MSALTALARMIDWLVPPRTPRPGQCAATLVDARCDLCRVAKTAYERERKRRALREYVEEER